MKQSLGLLPMDTKKHSLLTQCTFKRTPRVEGASPPPFDVVLCGLVCVARTPKSRLPVRVVQVAHGALGLAGLHRRHRPQYHRRLRAALTGPIRTPPRPRRFCRFSPVDSSDYHPPPSLLPILTPPPSVLPILPRSLAIGWNVFGTLKRLSAQASAAGGGMTARLGGDGAVPRTLTVGRSPAGGAVEIVHAIGVRDRGSRRWH